MSFGEFVLRLSESGSLSLVCAFLIGLLAAISPCPLATNITAMAYIGRQISKPKHVVISGLLYTLGRVVSYFSLGAIIILIGINIPRLSLALENAGERFLGPLLIIMGILLLGFIKLPGGQLGRRLYLLGERVARMGSLGAFLLGVVFALAFCPNTAVLFFGILIPLSLTSSWGITFPAAFAIGTGLPVFLFAILLYAGISTVTRWVTRLTAAEKVMRIVVAFIFIGTGLYYLIMWLMH